MNGKRKLALAALIALFGGFLFLRPGKSPEGVIVTEQERSDGGRATAVDPAAPVAPAAALSATDRAKLRVLEEVVTAKNDNDPRLDRELRDLSPPLKEALRRKYAQFRPEARNERGTVVFVLGREISDERDVAFLESVLDEPECLSLGDCSQAAGPSKRDNDHVASASEITLVYPQMVALSMIERYAQHKGAQPAMIESLRKALEDAKDSPSDRVSRRAHDVSERLRR